MARRSVGRVAIATLLSCASAVHVRAQTPDGAALFSRACASCHTGGAESKAPALATLQPRTPESIIEALVTGAMRVQGSRLSGAERRAIAEFVTGKTISGEVSGANHGRCAAMVQPFATQSAASHWSGWSPTPSNTRFQSSDQALLTGANISTLKLKWAFGFPDASVAWSQPTVSNSRVFVGSQNGTVYSLAILSGCINWTFAAAGGVRTAITVGPAIGAAPAVVYFGDTAAKMYALDADTGQPIWTRQVDDHPLARITGSPTLHDGRIYVPMSSYEESQGADPQYACCTFRGSVSALDARTGAVIWKSVLIPDAPTRRGTSSAGVPLWGPSGAAIWSAPTIDEKRGAVYVATGNAYSGPAPSTANAVIALDLATGKIRWTRQVTPGDVYVSNCRSGNPNCPENNGPDFDFGSPPMLARTPAGRDLIVIGQKSGVGYALDPDHEGAVVWKYQAGKGGVLGGIEWGSAVDGEHAYFAVSDITQPAPGGLHAVSLDTGERVWMTPAPALACGTGRGCSAAQSAALTAIPGVVFSGSVDGALRAYSAKTGEVLWQFDSNRSFETVNGVAAHGASMLGPGPAIAGGMLFVNSGYGAFLGRAGNVLLAFGVP
jgi:polyvinyl alcohol dehydrogenase (cytochrome)